MPIIAGLQWRVIQDRNNYNIPTLTEVRPHALLGYDLGFCSLNSFFSGRWARSAADLMGKIKEDLDGSGSDVLNHINRHKATHIWQGFRQIAPMLPEDPANVVCLASFFDKHFAPLIPDSPLADLSVNRAINYPLALRRVARIALLVETPFRYLAVFLCAKALDFYELCSGNKTYAAYLQFRLHRNQHLPLLASLSVY